MEICLIYWLVNHASSGCLLSPLFIYGDNIIGLQFQFLEATPSINSSFMIEHGKDELKVDKFIQKAEVIKKAKQNIFTKKTTNELMKIF